MSKLSQSFPFRPARLNAVRTEDRGVRYKFSQSYVDYYPAGRFSHLNKITDPENTIILTNENVYSLYQKKFKNWNTIILKPGEEYKIQPTVDAIIEQLIEIEADRKTTLVGVGGGVITDITGYVASIYMRGINFGFVPTTLLAMVDASIGGKNGIDVGVYKNMVGVIRQPRFLLFDTNFLKTLPEAEWQNGFAEIIKHACIKNANLFSLLEKNNIRKIQKNKKLLTQLVEINVKLKTKIVQQDEFEKGERKLLNFGHTLGHALENQYKFSHGQAVAIGMTYACEISKQLTGFSQTERVVQLLEQYGLPTYTAFNKQKVFNVLKMDKKRERNDINFILPEKIGKAVIKTITMQQLENIITNL